MAIKVNQDTVIDNNRAITGTALTVGAVTYPAVAGTAGYVLTDKLGNGNLTFELGGTNVTAGNGLTDTGTAPAVVLTLDFAGTSAANYGGVYIPDNMGLDILTTDGKLTLKKAGTTANTYGGVYVPDNKGLNLDTDGKLEGKIAGTDANNYGGVYVSAADDGLTLGTDGKISLDAATSTDLGGVYVPADKGLNLDTDGKLEGKIAGATAATYGGVYVPTADEGLILGTDGKLSLDKATATTLGGVIVGTGLSVTDGTISVVPNSLNLVGNLDLTDTNDDGKITTPAPNVGDYYINTGGDDPTPSNNYPTAAWEAAAENLEANTEVSAGDYVVYGNGGWIYIPQPEFVAHTAGDGLFLDGTEFNVDLLVGGGLAVDNTDGTGKLYVDYLNIDGGHAASNFGGVTAPPLDGGGAAG